MEQILKIIDTLLSGSTRILKLLVDLLLLPFRTPSLRQIFCNHEWTAVPGVVFVDEFGNNHVVGKCAKCGALCTAMGVIPHSEYDRIRRG